MAASSTDILGRVRLIMPSMRPRLLHPVAWWLWAFGLAIAAMRTTNPLLLLEIAAVAGFVVAARRVRAAWARSFAMLVRLAILGVILTVLLQLILGTRIPGHVLFTLPSVHPPGWAQGISLGGQITGETLLNAFIAGLRLAVLIVCFGAANSLAHPARLLRIMPSALYEVGVAIVVALTFVPQLAESAARIRNAQRLRGRPLTGLRGLRGLAVPVLEESLDRAIALAASMDSRGYGRRAAVHPARRRTTAAMLLAGLIAACLGAYFVVDPGSDHAVGVVLLGAGAGVALAAGLLTGRRVNRTRYRPDPWAWPEWLVTGTGAVVAATYVAFVHDSPDTAVALAWPALPVAPFLATLIAAVPAFATPPPPSGVRSVAPVPQVPEAVSA